jgi:hypothetical protein
MIHTPFITGHTPFSLGLVTRYTRSVLGAKTTLARVKEFSGIIQYFDMKGVSITDVIKEEREKIIQPEIGALRTCRTPKMPF